MTVDPLYPSIVAGMVLALLVIAALLTVIDRREKGQPMFSFPCPWRRRPTDGRPACYIGKRRRRWTWSTR